MNFTAFILHTNRPDLCEKASLSLLPIEDLVIIDNSVDGYSGVTQGMVYRPPVPLSAPQSFNFAMRTGKRKGNSFILTMHEDAESTDHAAEKLAEFARMYTYQNRKWGVLFTSYDALAAYNLDILEDVGLWDTNFHHYYSDNDYFRRLRLAGYDLIDTNLPVIHHGSQTIKSDPERNFMNGILFPADGSYYEKKWGGSPGQETYERPFNR